MALSPLRSLSPHPAYSSSSSSSSSSSTSSTSSSSASSSASSFYSASYSSISPPLLCTDTLPAPLPRYRQFPPALGARHSLETLIHSRGPLHGQHPTSAPPVTSSSLQHISPPSSSTVPSSSSGRLSAGNSDLKSPVSHSRPQSCPIAIPQRPLPLYADDLLASTRDSTHIRRRTGAAQLRLSSRPDRHSTLNRPVSGMRADRATYLSPTVSTAMSPASRPGSPALSFSRTSPSTKPGPAFHLGNLPRFHPAVYQASSDSTFPTSQPPSPRQVRQPSYRPTLCPRDSSWQYREAVENLSLPRTPPGPLSPSPSAPRLDPLRSPGPVTPLALEESGGYLAAGCTNTSTSSATDTSHGGPAPELMEKLIAQEQERSWQKSRKTAAISR